MTGGNRIRSTLNDQEKNMKVLHCRDVGFDCEAVVRAENEEEVLQIAGQHAKSAHNVEVTPEMAKQISTLIRDEPAQKA
jgi:predicted small metal-binding protein